MNWDDWICAGQTDIFDHLGVENVSEKTEKRARLTRSDAGVIRQTGRDARWMALLAEMYGAPVDLIGGYLNLAQPTLYRLVGRWRRAGWTHQGHVDAGPGWVWPTAQVAGRYLGWDVRTWTPRPSTAAHTRAVLATRLHLVGDEPGRWISERQLRHEEGWRRRGEVVDHCPDGVVTWDSGSESLVEVELTAKTPEKIRWIITQLVTQANDQNRGIIYFCTSGAYQTVKRELAAQTVEHPRATGWTAERAQVRSIEEVKLWKW